MANPRNQAVTPKAYAFHSAPTATQQGAQGQDFYPIYWGGPDGNVPDSDTCAVRITMKPGKVSIPHIHDRVQVTISLESGWFGVLTLWGDNLENRLWLRPGGFLTIRPGVPHVALYPTHRPDTRERIHVDAIAAEFRNTPDYRDDVRQLPHLWSAVRKQANQMGIEQWLRWSWVA